MPKPTASKADALLRTIGQMTPELPGMAQKAQAKPKPAKAAADAPGKFSSIYLNPEDQRLLAELRLWFTGQGRKVNDTLILRAALRAAKQGRELLAACDEAAAADRRRKSRE